MPETYPYEQLDSKRFQRLAQALLTDEYPGVECFPLSGSDGGRDAVRVVDNGSTDMIVYQVKFKEQQPIGVPSATALYKWITGQLLSEIEKLNELLKNGATNYVVISNIPASANREVGLRAKMTKWAEENLPLPTVFWWRDDLDARLAKNYDLIFRFGLFTGTESVRAVLEEVFRNKGSNQGAIQQSETPAAILALMSYLADQYRIESKLRFEQADLPGSPLLDLFVDVPISLRAINVRSRAQRRAGAPDEPALGSTSPYTGEIVRGGGVPRAGRRFMSPNTGGASFILAENLAKPASRMVLEGAPGQGKSTLGQYVCQTHRIKLLNKPYDLHKLPPFCVSSPVRIPIRVEFRHLATWFSGSDPWSSQEVSGTHAPHHWAQSLESFIAAHVRHSSGGMSFTPEDVVSILTKTPSFIFLDGLDEVADIKLRQTVVEAVEASINRLESLNANMQILVTTRPGFFLKAPSFSQRGFTYYRLISLTKNLILHYTEAWMRVREIPSDQSSEILHILEASLAQTHVAELARNPMQLAILLWLISVKGRSLPDQRTALYDQYLTAFLDREASKSATVRAHRARLLEIHGFIGWVLHCRTESRDSKYAGGDISAQELRDIIRAYLIHEERPTDLVEELFQGAERVFVLVSRIEGKFEFEVQPLREFFAARFLYKTAPHSTPGEPAQGARPDRLEQLIRNPYWLNVARFFCGWYDKGELADLMRRLKDLLDDPDYKRLGLPRYLIAYILQDCTTAESQRDTRELVTAMLDPLGLRLLTSRSSDFINTLGSSSSNSLLPG